MGHRNRVIISKSVRKVPDISEAGIADSAPKPEPVKSKKQTSLKTLPKAEGTEPVWSVRHNSESLDEPDVSGIDLRELFETKTEKKGIAEGSQQGIAVGEQDMPAIGVSFPSFSLEMFVGQTVLPVSSCYALAGPTASFKSHLVLEMARWVAGAGGTTVLAENESKYNADMATAVMGHTRGAKVWVYHCRSFNEVQKCLVNSTMKMDTVRDPGLFLEIIDSVVGNATKSSQDKVKSAGEIERGYSPNALAAANFLPNYMPMLANKPYLGVWVTHSSEKEESLGPIKKTVTTLKGGGSWEYRCRIAFLLSRRSDKPKYEDKTWRVKLLLQMKKDASVRGFKLPVEVVCGNDVVFDKERNDYFSQRRLRFCWDAATLEMWKSPEIWGYPEFYGEAVKDLTGFMEVKVSGRKCYVAPKIGIGKEEATKDASAVLDALYRSPQILDQLRAELGIQKGIAMLPNSSFATLREQAKNIAVRRASLMKAKSEVTFIRRAEVFDV